MDLNALFKLTHGLYILGARDGNRYVGSVVDAVMQAANQPVMICLSCANTSYTKECIERTNEFSLSVLGKDVDPFVISNFGFQSSRNINKWETVKFYDQDNLPYIENNIATVACKVIQKIIYESNTVFLAEVFDCSNNRDADVLTYGDYRNYFKTKVLENLKKKAPASDIVEEEKDMEDKSIKVDVKSEENDKHWVCSVCDYVYDEEGSFDDLPEDWTCPVCGVAKSFFVKK